MKKSISAAAARWPWLAVIGLTILGLVAGSYAYYRSEASHIRQEKYQEIVAIADLKIKQIEQWRNERLRDALKTAQSPFFREAVAQWLQYHATPDLQSALQKRLKLEQMEDKDDALLLDTGGRLLLSARARPDPMDAAAKQAIKEALATRAAALSDLYRCPRGIAHMDAVAPILNTEGRPIALVLLHTNAEKFLYPLIQSWPTPSHTAETLLVRKDGAHVLFLNDLRHRTNTAFTLREPLTRIDLPAVQAVLGRQGMLQGRDYRNVKVLADLRPIPGSAWFMVAKVDTHEIMTEARYRAGMIALVVFLSISLVASTIVYIYQSRLVDERRQAEEGIRELNIELERRVRERTAQLEIANKELEAFSYSVSHDLRAPLRAIDGFSRVVLDDYTEKIDEEGKRYLNIIRSNTQKMGQLIEDLLAFSHVSRQAIRASDIDMEKLARAVFDEMKLDVPERKVKLTIKKLPFAQGDPTMIRQVFTNLLSNAVKFTRPKDVASIEINCSNGKKENVYCIKDNGVGFDMRYVDKLFGVFQRLHGSEEFEGTGVGLAIVQRIILRHGGRVWAEGAVNEGASFYFTLRGEEGIK